MKKALGLVFILTFTINLHSTDFFELSFGMDSLWNSDYTQNNNDIYNNLNSTGLLQNFKPPTRGEFLEITGGHMIDSPAGKTGIYLRFDLTASWSEYGIKYPSNQKEQIIDSDAGLTYLGAGCRYFFPLDNGILDIFCGGDIGIAGAGGFSDSSRYDTSGNDIADDGISYGFNPCAAGNLEAGFIWWCTGGKDWAVLLKTGYRFASADMDAKVVSVSGLAGGFNGATGTINADFSGAYINIGVVLYINRIAAGTEKANDISNIEPPEPQDMPDAGDTQPEPDK